MKARSESRGVFDERNGALRMWHGLVPIIEVQPDEPSDQHPKQNSTAEINDDVHNFELGTFYITESN